MMDMDKTISFVVTEPDNVYIHDTMPQSATVDGSQYYVSKNGVAATLTLTNTDMSIYRDKFVTVTVDNNGIHTITGFNDAANVYNGSFFAINGADDNSITTEDGITHSVAVGVRIFDLATLISNRVFTQILVR
jgi:hypothetical protein